MKLFKQKSTLTQEIYNRARAEGGFHWLLPDPDPVLNRLADRGEAKLRDLSADPVLFGLIEQRKLATLNREFHLRPGKRGANSPSPASKRLALALERDLSCLDLRALINNLLDAPLYGLVPVELLWGEKAGQLHLKEARCLPGHWFRFNTQGELRFFPALGSNPEGEAIPPGKVLPLRHAPSYENPYGQRALSRCFWPVNFRRGGFRAWVRVAEDFNLPLLAGTYPLGLSLEDQDDLLSALSQARSGGVVILPEGSKLEVHSSDRSKGAEIHEKLIARLTEEMTRAILTQTLTSSLGGAGSRAATETHKGILDEVRQADQGLVKDWFYRLSRLYRDLNDPSAAPPEFTWYEEENPSRDWAERDEILTRMGVRFNPAYLTKKYGLSEADFSLISK